MRALSIKQPWAGLIAAGYKNIENRSWATSFRGRFLIHAGNGEATVYNCVDAGDWTAKGSPWFFGPYGFAIRDAKLWDRPIPYRGQLGFFEVDEAAVR